MYIVQKKKINGVVTNQLFIYFTKLAQSGEKCTILNRKKDDKNNT